MFTFTGLSANSPFFLVGFFFTGFLSLLVKGKKINQHLQADAYHTIQKF